MPFCRKDIDQAASGMIASYGWAAEQEITKLAATARSKGLNVTAAEWERVRQAIKNLRISKSEAG